VRYSPLNLAHIPQRGREYGGRDGRVVDNATVAPDDGEYRCSVDRSKAAAVSVGLISIGDCSLA